MTMQDISCLQCIQKRKNNRKQKLMFIYRDISTLWKTGSNYGTKPHCDPDFHCNIYPIYHLSNLLMLWTSIKNHNLPKYCQWLQLESKILPLGQLKQLRLTNRACGKPFLFKSFLFFLNNLSFDWCPCVSGLVWLFVVGATAHSLHIWHLVITIIVWK